MRIPPCSVGRLKLGCCCICSGRMLLHDVIIAPQTGKDRSRSRPPAENPSHLPKLSSIKLLAEELNRHASWTPEELIVTFVFSIRCQRLPFSDSYHSDLEFHEPLRGKVPSNIRVCIHEGKLACKPHPCLLAVFTRLAVGKKTVRGRPTLTVSLDPYIVVMLCYCSVYFSCSTAHLSPPRHILPRYAMTR